MIMGTPSCVMPHGDAVARQIVICFVTLLHTMLSHSVAFTRNASQEYCQTEVFEAACAHGIIYMEEALYGRMALGRCVQTDYGNVGCHADVLRQTDRRCSGKPLCRIQIPDAEFDRTEPCPQDFKTYFQVAYTCLQVTVPAPPVSCAPNTPVEISEPFGYLSSSTTVDQQLGSPSCPWRLKVPRGQRINITLIDFKTPGFDPSNSYHLRPRIYHDRSTNIHDSSSSSGIYHERDTNTNNIYDSSSASSSMFGVRRVDTVESSCDYMYALLTERWSSDRTVRVCGGADRERHVFLSRTSSVDVVVTASNSAHQQYGDENFFLLKFEAVGCVDPPAPKDGFAERKDDETELGCNHSPLRWRHHCDGKTWVGPSHSCPAKKNLTGASAPSDGLPTQERASVRFGSLTLPLETTAAVTVGLAVIVGVLVLLVGLILVEWRKMKRAEQAERLASDIKLNVIPDLLNSRASGSTTLHKNSNPEGVSKKPPPPAPKTDTKSPVISSPIPPKEYNPEDDDYTYVKTMWPLAPSAPNVRVKKTILTTFKSPEVKEESDTLQKKGGEGYNHYRTRTLSGDTRADLAAEKQKQTHQISDLQASTLPRASAAINAKKWTTDTGAVSGDSLVSLRTPPGKQTLHSGQLETSSRPFFV